MMQPGLPTTSVGANLRFGKARDPRIGRFAPSDNAREGRVMMRRELVLAVGLSAAALVSQAAASALPDGTYNCIMMVGSSLMSVGTWRSPAPVIAVRPSTGSSRARLATT